MGTDVERLAPVASLDVLREQLAPNASDGELLYFGQVAQRLELDPFRNQIVLIPRYDSRVKREVYRPQVTIEGRRAIASRTGELVGIEGPWWCGAERPIVWEDVWLSPDPPSAARVLVYRRNHVSPYNGTAPWREFAQTRRDNGSLLGLWGAMPAHMLGKVAEAIALRRAFPEAIGDLVSVEFDDIDEPPREVATGTHDPAPERSPVRESGAVSEGAAPDSEPPEPEPVAPMDLAHHMPEPAERMTDDQVAEIAHLLHAVELSARDPGTTRAKLRVMSDALGRTITRPSEVTRAEAVVLIADLRDKVEAGWIAF